MATRSTKFGSVAPAAGVGTIVDTCPAGQVHLVKSILVQNRGGVPDGVQVYVRDSGGVLGILLNNNSLATFTSTAWEGWVVTLPGDTVQVYSALGTSHFWVSGAALPA